MPGNNLTSRLSFLKQNSKGKATLEVNRGAFGRGELPGWERLGEFLYRRREYLAADMPVMNADDGTEYKRLLFYDTETTGISSGTGTFIFLLGMAWAEQDRGAAGATTASRIILEQVFASDYPGEPEFLSYIGRRFKESDLFVSFNGKSYDSHLLRTRFLMNGMDFEPGEQYDLLHISRRLWGRLIGSCSLSNIEEKILGIYRNGDLPGYEVPERYFSFLRTGNAELLTDVFKHNRQDVISMVVLINLIEKILSGESMDIEFDYTSLGVYLTERGISGKVSGKNSQKAALGVQHLVKGFEKGDARAGRFLSIMHKRNGQWEKAIRIWHKMAEKKSPFAAIELAKYYEHKRKNYGEALKWVNKCLSWNIPLSTGDRYELIHRKNRLFNKGKRVTN